MSHEGPMCQSAQIWQGASKLYISYDISDFNNQQLNPLHPTQPPWAPDWEGARGRDHSFPRFWVRSSVWYDAPGLAQGGLKTFNQTHLFSTTYKAMNMLGLNPNEQEVIDIPNHVARLRQFKMQHLMSRNNVSGTTWSTFPTSARSCWTGCATQQRRRCFLICCPTRSPSSR